MRAASLAPRTIQARIDLVLLFAERTGLDPTGASWQDLTMFLAALAGAGTRQTYQGHFRAWYQWLVRMEYRPDDPTQKLHKQRVPRRSPRPFTIGQVSKILSQRMHRRTRAMVLLGAYEGFRVSEIAKVAGPHIEGPNIWVEGKGGVVDKVPLHPLVAEVAETFPARDFWFPSHVRPGPMTGNSASRIISDLIARAGVDGTAHQLRHFFLTEALRASGGNLKVAQELGRHASIATTAGYTKVDDEERRAAVFALPRPLRLISS